MAALLAAIMRVRWTPAVAAIALFGMTGGVALSSRSPSWAGASAATGLPECPQDSIRLIVRHDQTSTVVTSISVAPHIANVPEFNDCQAFVGPEGAHYLQDPNGGPALFAIFASETLDRLEGRLDSAAGRLDSTVASRRMATDPIALSAAEIYSFGLDYRPLGIEVGFNCLVLRRSFDAAGTATWHALMIAVGAKEVRCSVGLGLTPPPGSRIRSLAVLVRPNPPGLLPTDVPAVARWDWDSERKQHYIGIKCGGRWCEVGADGLVPSVGYVVADPRPELRRTRMIKGWYDQQFLAFQTGPGVVDVSLLLGTIYPSPDLDKWAESAPASPYANHWITAAYAQIHPPLALGRPAADLYRTRFNFAITPVGTRMNEIQLCFGTAAACFEGTGTPRPAGTFVSDCETVTAQWGTAPPWWSRVIQGGVGPGDVTFKCVRRRQHSGAVPHIPGAARWRWMVDDEGTWMRCLQGCCEKN